jgi:pilus retraction protein PilT
VRANDDLGAPIGPLLRSEEESSIDLDALLKILVDRGGSDLHLTTGIPPAIRINGELVHIDDMPVCEPSELQKMLYAIMTQKQREAFENELELDMSYAVPNLARFRVNVFQQRDSIGSVMRVIPFEIKPLEDLGVPEQVSNFAYLPRGFVLVTGPTGSGKSTTLASLIDLANRNRAAHIMTVEDPIEFLHDHKRSVVNQREVGTDTHGFTEALKHVLRQDPDIILVGEMRDLETIQIALTAAETGHLVFGTLHTQDAPQSIDRIIDVFPPHQQEQIRVMLAGALKGVVCQSLIKTADGQGPDRGLRGDGRDVRCAELDPRGQDPPAVLGDPGRGEQRHGRDGPVAGHARQAGHDHLRRGPREVQQRAGVQPARRSGLTRRTTAGDAHGHRHAQQVRLRGPRPRGQARLRPDRGRQPGRGRAQSSSPWATRHGEDLRGEDLGDVRPR